MAQYSSIRSQILEACERRGSQITEVLSAGRQERSRFSGWMKNQLAKQGNHVDDRQLDIGYAKSLTSYRQAIDIATRSKVVIFSARQAAVFENVTKNYADTLDYKLPFGCVLLQFDTPLEVPEYLRLKTQHGNTNRVLGLLLRQDEDTVENYNRGLSEYKQALEKSGINTADMNFQVLHETENGKVIQNLCIALYDTFHPYAFSWQSDTPLEKSYRDSDGNDLQDVNFFRNLAIACIGYINCENIYLHQEGAVPDKINRKREKQGKKILESYYVCRIRGVQYDSNGEPTGEGTHHGFRYDVRGHFRRLESGRTTWVRPHQRGLQHELYVPKTYVVEKGAKRMEPTP